MYCQRNSLAWQPSNRKVFTLRSCVLWAVTATKIPFMYSFFWEFLRGLSPNFHMHVFVSDLYILRIGPHISCSTIGRPIMGIYAVNRRQTHECGNWDCSRAFPCLGIFVSNVRFWFFAVVQCTLSRLLTLFTVHKVSMEGCEEVNFKCSF